jgi:hypothetical protein
MIEQLSGFPENVLGLRISGQVTREDFQNGVIPAVEAAVPARAEAGHLLPGG